MPPAAFGDRPPLASALIDTLFCILADSTGNMRIFEECGGLDAVMKVLKTKGGRKDVRSVEKSSSHVLAERSHRFLIYSE